ncbi:hypothetical protein JCM15765_15090 [Paradesulfitobacterium aromaticivorans]
MGWKCSQGKEHKRGGDAMSYEIVPNPRGYYELWVDGKFIGNFDSPEEAREEVPAA